MQDPQGTPTSGTPTDHTDQADHDPLVSRQVERRQTIVDRRYETTGLERRRGPGRRRTDFMKSAEEGQMTSEQFMFIMAIDAYKRANQRPFPTWTEVLEVIRKLGYRKTAPTTLQLDNVADWTEAPDSAAFPPPANDGTTRASD